VPSEKLTKVLDDFIEKLPVETKRSIGLERLKTGMWNAMGVDYVTGTGMKDDPTYEQQYRDLLAGKPNKTELKRLERIMENKLRELHPDGAIKYEKGYNSNDRT